MTKDAREALKDVLITLVEGNYVIRLPKSILLLSPSQFKQALYRGKAYQRHLDMQARLAAQERS